MTPSPRQCHMYYEISSKDNWNCISSESSSTPASSFPVCHRVTVEQCILSNIESRISITFYQMTRLNLSRWTCAVLQICWMAYPRNPSTQLLAKTHCPFATPLLRVIANLQLVSKMFTPVTERFSGNFAQLETAGRSGSPPNFCILTKTFSYLTRYAWAHCCL